MAIWTLITSIITSFLSAGVFSRTTIFVWFAVAVLGILCRADSYGVASAVRSLEIDGTHYEALLHFFRSTGISLPNMRECWAKLVKQFCPLHTVDGSYVFLIDHTKKSKEGVKTPGVQKHRQESETQSKAEYIFGHLFGGLSVVAQTSGDNPSFVGIPLMLQLQCGISYMVNWIEDESKAQDAIKAKVRLINKLIDDLQISTESCITQAVSSAIQATQWMKNSATIVADRAFLTIKCVDLIFAHNAQSEYKVHIVTRSRCNTVAFASLPSNLTTREKKNSRITLQSLFGTNSRRIRKIIGSFEKSIAWRQKRLIMYGKEELVTFIPLNLYWKNDVMLRFVLVQYGEKKCILVSTDLSLDPETIIKLYCCREKIECNFRELNQTVCAFSSRFWSGSMPRLNRFKKKTDPDPLEAVTDRKERTAIVFAVRAIEIYASIACISLGLIQIVSLKYSWTSGDFHWRKLQLVHLK